jgi:uncharacterized membrane protein YfcA
LDLLPALFIFFGGACAGALNSVAGGGGFIAFPTLVLTGIPEKAANATQTLALWPGVVSSAAAYRRQWTRFTAWERRAMAPLLVSSLMGGAGGALLLLRTPEETFVKLIPWLMLAATLLFAFGRNLTQRLRSGRGDVPAWWLIAAVLLQLPIATYGGFFGGGLGILILALLATLGMKDMHVMNSFKTIMGATVNGAAAFTFFVTRAAVWPQAAVMIAGAMTGGYLGAHYAQKIDPEKVRWLVIAVGAAMTAWFFMRA